MPMPILDRRLSRYHPPSPPRANIVIALGPDLWRRIAPSTRRTLQPFVVGKPPPTPQQRLVFLWMQAPPRGFRMRAPQRWPSRVATSPRSAGVRLPRHRDMTLHRRPGTRRSGRRPSRHLPRARCRCTRAVMKWVHSLGAPHQSKDPRGGDRPAARRVELATASIRPPRTSPGWLSGRRVNVGRSSSHHAVRVVRSRPAFVSFCREPEPHHSFYACSSYQACRPPTAFSPPVTGSFSLFPPSVDALIRAVPPRRRRRRPPQTASASAGVTVSSSGASRREPAAPRG